MKRRDEEGFILIYVLGIAALVTILATTAISVTTSNIKPTQHSVYANAATAAAQAGISTYIAGLETNQTGACTSASTACLTAVNDPAGWIAGTSSKTCGESDWASGIGGGTYAAGYATTAEVVAALDVVRVRSVGCAGNRGMASSKTLVADIQSPKASYLNYGNVTKYETQSPSSVQSQFPPRTIAITDSTVQHAANDVTPPLSSGATVTWGGAKGGTLTPQYLSTDACNKLWYSADGQPGRSTQSAQIDTALDAAADTYPALPGAPSYADWGEQLTTGGSLKTTYAYHPCAVTLSGSTTLLAPADTTGGAGGYYSTDAQLLNDGVHGGVGPLLNQPVSTSWSPADTPQAPSSFYRTFDMAPGALTVGGSPAPGSTYPTVTHAPFVIDVPSAMPTPVANACIYTGPTRIRMSGTTAYVTSPGTTGAQPGSSLGCYGGTAPGPSGLLEVPVTGFAGLTHGAVYVTGTGAPSTWATTGQRSTTTPDAAHSVFYASAGSSGSTTVDTYTGTSASTAGAAAVQTPGSPWGSGTSTTCPALSLTVNTQEWFNCQVKGLSSAYYTGSYQPASTFNAWLQATLRSQLASTSAFSSGAMASQADISSTLITQVNTAMAHANSSDASDPAPTNPSNASRRWIADSVNTSCSTVANNGPPSTSPAQGPLHDDALFTDSGTVTTTTGSPVTTCTVPVYLQVGSCTNVLTCNTTKVWSDGGVAGLGITAGTRINQFTVTVTVTHNTVRTDTTAAVSYFPSMQDVTQYAKPNGANTPGDLYLEGTVGQTLSFTADHDIVLTGSLTPTSQSTVGIGLVAKNDVRLYNPVGCAVAPPAGDPTTPGFCPNDMTGLYYGVPAAGTAPYLQYANLRPSGNVNVTAAIFALGLANPNCAGCSGELTVDNFNRGSETGTLAVTGTTVQVHHGPTGEQWDAPNLANAPPGTRPHTGYELTCRYLDLSALGIAGLPTAASRGWHIVSTSTG